MRAARVPGPGSRQPRYTLRNDYGRTAAVLPFNLLLPLFPLMLIHAEDEEGKRGTDKRMTRGRIWRLLGLYGPRGTPGLR